MDADKLKELEERIAGVEMVAGGIAVTLVERGVLKKEDVIKNLDTLSLGAAVASGRGAAEAIERVIGQIRRFPGDLSPGSDQP